MSIRKKEDVRLPSFTRPLQPLVDMVAATPASVHTKLLAGFLATAVLLIGRASRSSSSLASISGRRTSPDFKKRSTTPNRCCMRSPRRVITARWPS